MSLLSKMMAAVVVKKGEREMRAYRRFKATIQWVLRADFEDHTKLTIEDLSFGGVAIALPEGYVTEPMPQVLVVQVVDECLRLSVETVRRDGSLIAYRFIDRDLGSVVALHNLLRGLEKGVEMASTQAPRPQSGADGRVIALKSAAGTRLILEVSPAGTLVHLRLNFADDGRLCELISATAALVSARTVATADSLMVKQGIETGRHEPIVLRQAIFILMGVIEPNARPLVKKPIALCMNALGLRGDEYLASVSR